jgi:hypothetical protein
VPGVGAEIVLTVDGELRKTRLFRCHERAELVGAIADTRTMFEGRSGRERRAEIVPIVVSARVFVVFLVEALMPKIGVF